jgi:hypothetical protein
METLNRKDEGYRGIWYMNQPSEDEYVFKYSGGLGTYCAKHQPFAVYSPSAEKTFFCWGGTVKNDYQRLHHMVSYYDHATGMVPKPTVLLDKQTDDAHDNPVISLDSEGYVWVFSTSHGTIRPSCIHRSTRPYSVDQFERVPATRIVDGDRIPFDNFSYMQIWHVPEQGFVAFMTHYNDPAIRTSFFITSPDGFNWSEWQRLAAIEQGHYQISAANERKVASAFNFHPGNKQPGLNWRTNLYYMESSDFGNTWNSAEGNVLTCPLSDIVNPALVHDYQKEGLNVYLKDIVFDSVGHPIILYLTSKGYEAGPGNAPRTWTTARWNGTRWDIRSAMESDNNYDTGSIYVEGEGIWRIIAPTEPGPQAFNPGGEVAIWVTENYGMTWSRVRQLTSGSERNHTYIRRPVNAHPDFYALWADGHARKPSPSRVYFCNREGDVYILPEEMDDDLVQPLRTSDADKPRS